MFIGGSHKLYKKRGLYLNLGKNLYYLGKHGAGYSAKIAQVSLCYLNYLSLSEAFNARYKIWDQTTNYASNNR